MQELMVVLRRIFELEERQMAVVIERKSHFDRLGCSGTLLFITITILLYCRFSVIQEPGTKMYVKLSRRRTCQEKHSDLRNSSFSNQLWPHPR